MINLNASPSDFYSALQGKKLYLFGMGVACSHYHEVFCRFYPIQGIVDNNPLLHGKIVNINEQTTKVLSIRDFASILQIEGMDDVVLLITSTAYGLEISEQLNHMPELSGLTCYQGLALRFFPVNHEKISFTDGPQKIPKKIHYCWFGGASIPSHLQQYIDGWKRLCPDYEIIEWNESNYDVLKNRYMREAYEAKKWSFSSDYAKLDIIYNHGGIGLDIDVELVRRPDKLLNDDAFFGFFGNDEINLGSGFGAVLRHPLIKAFRDFYDDKSFINADGSLNLIPCPHYQHPVFKNFGFVLENRLQRIQNVVVYPSDVLRQIKVPASENTIACHYGENSWFTPNMRKQIF